jgi:hypothetical protein
MSSSITTTSHSNIHVCRPATLLVRPLLSTTPTPCSKSPLTSRPPLSHSIPPATSPSCYPPLSTYSSRIPTDWERPCELTDSPTPSTFYPRTRTLSKSKSHAANHRRHRQSDIANPARHHRNTGTPFPCSPTGSLPRRLSHLYPTNNLSRHTYDRLHYPPFFCCFTRPAIYGARDSPRINISVYECALRRRGRSFTRVSSWRGRFAQIGFPVLQHAADASGRPHEQR